MRRAVAADRRPPAIPRQRGAGYGLLLASGRALPRTSERDWPLAVHHRGPDDRLAADLPPLRRPLPIRVSEGTTTAEREQRRVTGDWWRRVRRRPGKPDWPSVPAVVLDPFAGSGTTLAVARAKGRRAVGIELQDEYLPLIKRRILQETQHGVDRNTDDIPVRKAAWGA